MTGFLVIILYVSLNRPYSRAATLPYSACTFTGDIRIIAFYLYFDDRWLQTKFIFISDNTYTTIRTFRCYSGSIAKDHFSTEHQQCSIETRRPLLSSAYFFAPYYINNHIFFPDPRYYKIYSHAYQH